MGIRPSVETSDKSNIETNIFEFNEDIYGEYITVEFLKMIRPEIKFSNTTELFNQIHKDIAYAKEFFIQIWIFCTSRMKTYILPFIR